MNADIRSELRAATDAESMCALLRSRCESFGTVCFIDVLPLARSRPKALACIADMETAEEAHAAQVALGLPSFGTRSLVCVVEAPGFSLAFPYRYHGRYVPAARAA